MTVYMPSFFGGHQERVDLFKKSILAYLKFGYEVVVFWMNDEEHKIIDDRIKYIDSKEVFNASICRNRLLDIFYNTDEPRAIFSDDDVIIKARIEHENDFDLLSLTNDYSSELKKTHEISSSFFILKNLDNKLYFDEMLDANQDLDFGINLVNNGYECFRLKDENIVINRGKSVMFDNPMQKIHRKSVALDKIKIKWNLK